MFFFGIVLQIITILSKNKENLKNPRKNESLVEEFLINYTSDFDFNFERNFENIAIYCCENYLWNPQCLKREFSLIAYGYFLAKTDKIVSTILVFEFEQKMEKIYSIIAENNNWNDDE